MVFTWALIILLIGGLLLLTSIDIRSFPGNYSKSVSITTLAICFMVPIIIASSTTVYQDQYIVLLSPDPIWRNIDNIDDILNFTVTSSSHLVTILLTVLLLLYIVTLAPFGVLLRKHCRMSASEQISYKHVRTVLILCGMMLLGAPITWPLIIMGAESGHPGNAARYCVGVFILLESVLMFVLLIWSNMSKEKYPAAAAVTSGQNRFDNPDGQDRNGVLQPYLNYKNGRSDHQPNGVRGTVSKLGQQYQQNETQRRRQRQHSSSSSDSNSYSNNAMDDDRGASMRYNNQDIYNQQSRRRYSSTSDSSSSAQSYTYDMGSVHSYEYDMEMRSTIRASYESNLDQFREDDDETDYIDARKEAKSRRRRD